MFSDGAENAHDMLRFADTAMYEAKGDGKNRITLFQESMDEHVNRQLELENALRIAMSADQFVLFYQPKYRASDGSLCGAEALIRWQHPEKGVVAANYFIDTLESCGLITRVGSWVMETAFRQLARWLADGLWNPQHRLSINISPRQFREERFVSTVKSLLNKINVPPSSIEMELTEHTVIHCFEDALNKMNQLIDLGFTFSLDDFGTGYSSLSYLKRLPVEIIKIDRSFVRDITEDPNEEALVSSILAMSRHLNKKVVAEGVETKQQVDILNKNECDYFQGYYYSQPLSQDKLTAVLKGLLR